MHMQVARNNTPVFSYKQLFTAISGNIRHVVISYTILSNRGANLSGDHPITIEMQSSFKICARGTEKLAYS